LSNFLQQVKIVPFLRVSKNTLFRACPFKCKWAAAPGTVVFAALFTSSSHTLKCQKLFCLLCLNISR